MGFLLPAQNEKKIQLQLEEIRNAHPNATHHCYAYRMDLNNTVEFDQDDGEPSGSAGLPILNKLRSFETINALLVAVRYYGGTKLGKAGLIDAYGYTAELCLNKAKLHTIVPVKLYRVVYGYPQQGLIDRLKNNFTILERSSEYLEDVTLEFGCPVEASNRLESILSDSAHLLKEWKSIGESHHIVK